MAVDVTKLWDYSKPALSEERFRAALVGASADEALILQTQIARTWGLRKDFTQARQVLESIKDRIPTAAPEVQVRYWLESGRTYASPVHPQEMKTAENREVARQAYMRAFDLAKGAALDNLAIDALHMMPMVDTDPQSQLDWGLKAIAYMEASSQPDAKKWEGALYNNVGYALYLAGRYDEALVHYRKSLASHERGGRVVPVRVAHWMIAQALRAQKKYGEALVIQLRLEREWDAAGEPDPYVYEELEHLYRALGDEGNAKLYATKLATSRQK